uniref:Uncharacterized protein n=2 Tax=Nymphaea colorata TaxID=210225 RepID=A0A5K0WTR1_9MAGN
MSIAQFELRWAMGTERLVKESDIQQLPLMKETLRLHPPVLLLIPHRAYATTEQASPSLRTLKFL